MPMYKEMSAPRPATFIALGMMILGAGAGCRTPRRSVPTDGLPAKFTVTLTGLDEADQGKTDWIYELSGCINTLNGNLESDNKVLFTAIGLKRGLDDCTVRVRVASPAPTYTFAGAESGVLYLAKNVTVSQNPNGGLAASAELQKLYGINISSDTRFSLKVPVVFPAEESGKLITGLMDSCQPNFTASSTFEKGSGRSGTLIFTASVPTEVAIECKSLRIDVGGIAQKYASLPTDSFKFKAKPGSTSELPSVTVAAAAKGSEGGKGVSVKTTPATKQCDPAKEIYDTISHTCKPKP
jgi:hypothetical protein